MINFLRPPQPDLPATSRNRPRVDRSIPRAYLSVTRRHRRPALLLAALLAHVAPLMAHNPHDPVDALALSPTFSSDGLVFTAQLPADNYRTQDPLVSSTRGWTWTGMPGGMDSRSAFSSVSVSPRFATDGTLFYTSFAEGVFRSLDRGASWTRVNNGVPLELRSSVTTIDLQDKLVLFVVSLDGRLFRTRDLGVTWKEITPPGSNKVFALGVSPDFVLDSTLMTADALGSLFVSTDGGTHWVDRGPIPGAGKIAVITLMPGYADSGELFVSAVSGGLLRSTDSGQSFLPAGQGLPPETVTAVEASPSYPVDHTLFATTTRQAVFKSTDSGGLWIYHDVGARLNDQTPRHFGVLRLSDAFATDQTLFLGSFEGLYTSTDGGETWTKQDTRPPALATALATSPSFLQDGTIAASTYGGGVYVSEDRGTTWRPANIGLGYSSLYDIVFAPGELYASHRSGVVRSVDAGRTWQKLPFGGDLNGVYPTDIGVSPPDGGQPTILAGTREDGIIGTADGGAHWLRLVPKTPGNPVPGISALVWAPAAADQTVFGATWTGQIMRSTDGGITWRRRDTGIPVTDNPIFLAISPAFSLDRKVAAGTSQGLYATANGGDTWAPLGSDPRVSGGNIEAVAFSPAFASDRTMLVSVRGVGLLRSEDGGMTWTPVAAGMLENGVQFVELEFSPDFAQDHTLFGASGASLLRSVDRGDTWQAIDLDPVRYEDTRQLKPSPNIDYTKGDWLWFVTDQASVSTVTAAARPGAFLRFGFYGSQVTWIGSLAANLGIAQVWIDGQMVAEVDQYSATQTYAVPLFTSQVLPLGPHEIRLLVTDQSNPDSSGTVTTLDAFDVRR